MLKSQISGARYSRGCGQLPSPREAQGMTFKGPREIELQMDSRNPV